MSNNLFYNMGFFNKHNDWILLFEVIFFMRIKELNQPNNVYI
jgi:hypothetical protein